MSISAKRRETEVFSLAFLDCICCGFGAVILMFMTVKFAPPQAIEPGLQDLGIGKGHRVGIFLPNTPHFVITYFAVLKTGATVVNFNPLYAERDIIHQIEDSGVELMVTLDLTALYDKLAPLFETTRLKRLIICRMAPLLPRALKLPSCDFRPVCLVCSAVIG